jgi:hypothetical protein
LRQTIPTWDNFFKTGDEEERASGWIRLEVLAEPLVEKYAWAVPSERALSVLSSFSPLIEIGAGKGYWAHLLSQRGVDIVAFDKFAKKLKNKWFDVEVGGPKVLQRDEFKGRALFLCYPDETADVAMQCLERYSGEYVLHVGELVGTGTWSGAPQVRTALQS